MLSNVSLFSGLPEADRNAIAELATIRSFPRNTIIISEGDDSDSMYVVLSGKVKVYLSDDEGKEIIINILKDGDYFGELALLDESPRSASVMTQEDSKLAVLSKTAFEDCLKTNPGIALEVIKGLSARLRNLTDNVKSLALMDVYGRVARTLLDMSETHDGVQVITQKLTQRDIASMVGASREMVSRILKDLSIGGYITIENKTITINEKLPHGW
ncbi:MAG: Crp/Fnr family transcriptional regulator [Gammaproteobacteria bacterium]|nr:Crp/Fnr family transcriptional regulator [Gammaproteobacteria bacterium]MDH5801354.1 Crp/Fnr family transcriptional regulator [Gammaproteobacteria bacterium]